MQIRRVSVPKVADLGKLYCICSRNRSSPNFDLRAPRPLSSFLPKLVGTCPLLRFLSPLSCRSVVGTCLPLRLLSPLAPWPATVAAWQQRSFSTLHCTADEVRSLPCEKRNVHTAQLVRNRSIVRVDCLRVFCFVVAGNLTHDML